jgi:hypothetical protein
MEAEHRTGLTAEFGMVSLVSIVINISVRQKNQGGGERL